MDPEDVKKLKKSIPGKYRIVIPQAEELMTV